MCTENFVKFGHVVLERSQWTDRHRDRLIALLCTPTRDEVKMLEIELSSMWCLCMLSFILCTYFNVNLSVACRYSYSLLFSLLPSHLVCNQATGYASQLIWCLSQARINWEDCGRKASCVKMGDEGGGSLISSDGVAPSRIVGVCLWYLLLHYKVQKKISSDTGSSS